MTDLSTRSLEFAASVSPIPAALGGSASDVFVIGHVIVRIVAGMRLVSARAGIFNGIEIGPQLMTADLLAFCLRGLFKWNAPLGRNGFAVSQAGTDRLLLHTDNGTRCGLAA